MDFSQWYAQARQQARQAEVDIFELEWLAFVVLGGDRLALRLGNICPHPDQLQALDQLWQRRLHEQSPVQYLAGRSYWRDLELNVAPGVLIPRPETELIIDLVQQWRSPSFGREIWLDLGTGSGVLAIALAQALPHADIHAIDLSPQALAIAQANGRKYGLDQRITWHQGNWFEPISHLQGQISGMVSNPPYIPTRMIAELAPQVAKHEPRLALDGGEDGLVAIAHLVTQAPLYLAPGALWLIEVMAGQAEQVCALLATQGSYTQIKVHLDQAGLPRFVAAIT
ncbi:MAG: peptide chain release factor N(5)-glutamine methyltransferase [Pseudanabaenaceae cyanobacterium bins.68]|nr:peptide chain release factor N(5)-glutamine methyltransferase [Pseudanabaenaceae cyanobacterium bins.68]